MSAPTPPTLPIRVVRIESIGGACPFQCEGVTDDGREVYVRYRGGWFRAYVAGRPGGDALDDDARLLISESIGHPLDGSLDPQQMVDLTAGVIKWPVDLRPAPDQEEDDRA